jgi:hypothetical protein
MKTEILLVAAVSRLLDLHDSKRERGTPTKPVVPPRITSRNSAYHLSLGLAIIDALQQLEQDEGDWFQHRSSIVTVVKNIVPSAEEVDIDYCLRVLSGSREIHFISDDQGQHTFTKEKTPLLDRTIGEYDQYKLSENARLLARVSALKNNWLYEDQDTEKIVRAIENGYFEDVPRLCRERINSILAVGREITKMEECVSTEESIKEFVASYDDRMEILRCALDIIKKAMILLRSDNISGERFDEWQKRTNRFDIAIGNILSDLEAVAQMIEKISRRITAFVVSIRANRRAAIEVISFLDKAESIIKLPPSAQMLESLLESVAPTGLSPTFFSPLDFIESVDLNMLDEDHSLVRELSIGDMIEAGNERLSQFLERNRGWVIKRLRTGPLTFQELIQTGEFIIEPGESIADFYGIYAVPDEFGRDLFVSVGINGGKMNYIVDGVCMHGDNPILFLEAGKK